MVVRKDGRLARPPEPARLFREHPGGEPLVIPPPREFHGVGLPGGELHRNVSMTDAGFATPGMLADIEALKFEIAELKRCSVDPAHSHPELFSLLEKEAQKIARHSHPELVDRIEACQEGLVDLEQLASTRANKLERQLDDCATIAHTHPPQPLPKHEHREIGGRIDVMAASLEAHAEILRELGERVESLAKIVTQLGETADFLRDAVNARVRTAGLDADAIRRIDVASLPAVGERTNGLMTAAMRNRLEVLWAERKTGPASGSTEI